jgi:phosphoribosylformimino-5-aminoimidazole carboxamide ribotide isomerase
MRNYDVIKQITKCVDIPVQLGGGIRDYDTAKKVITELGVYRIVLGTAAISNPDLVKELIKDFGSSKIIIGIDEKENKVMMDGWVNSYPCTVLDFANEMKSLGVTRIIYQDISRVGSLSGPNLERLKEIGDKVKIKLTSAGGIRDYRDLKSIKGLEAFGVDSVIVSRALYENKFPCQNIWREVERVDTSLDLPSVC